MVRRREELHWKPLRRPHAGCTDEASRKLNRQPGERSVRRYGLSRPRLSRPGYSEVTCSIKRREFCPSLIKSAVYSTTSSQRHFSHQLSCLSLSSSGQGRTSISRFRIEVALLESARVPSTAQMARRVRRFSMKSE